MNKILSYIYVGLVMAVLTACNTLRSRDFEKVQMGMEKDQVINLIGGPDHSQRWKGRDRWIYRFHNSDSDWIKEVHFENGKVIHVGDPLAPATSATEQDGKNAEYNKAQEQIERDLEVKRRKEIQKSFEPDPNEEAQKVAPTYKEL